MSDAIKEEIDILVNEISRTLPIHKIFLFGSFAYGQPNDDSDIDLCVITTDKVTRKKDLLRKIRKNISTIANSPVDILLYQQDEFFERANLNSTLEYKIISEGVQLYEQ